jgi:hypothetical protein
MGSPEVISQVEEITGHRNLFVDPDCNMLEGMHHNSPESNLGMHRDGLWNKKAQGFRVLNFILYLNPEWKEGNGGEISLWDRETKTQGAEYQPLFNRTIIMACHWDTIHTVWPVKNIDRNSLAIYYYVRTSPDPRNVKIETPEYYEWDY